MIRHAMSAWRIGEFQLISQTTLLGCSFSTAEGYYNVLFSSCNCFQNKFFIIKKSSFYCFVAVIIQATYAKIDSFSTLCLKLTIILWRLRWPCTRCFHIMWRDWNTRNIHPTLKYLILPLATADYDEHFVHKFLYDVDSNASSLLLYFQQCSAKQNFSNQHPNEVFSRNPNNNVW